MKSVCLFAVLLTISPLGRAASSVEEATARGRRFLTNLLDPSLGLLPEYRGAKVYWLFHDNYLGAKTLAATQPDVSRAILAAIHREGVEKSGKIEVLFREAQPLPFRHYQLADVRRAGESLIRTEVVTDRLLTDWESYADLLLLACIAQAGQPAGARHWEAALRLWDGKGRK